jgi:hypothetical protein
MEDGVKLILPRKGHGKLMYHNKSCKNASKLIVIIFDRISLNPI